MVKSKRRHALFICSNLTAATQVSPMEKDSPLMSPTTAGIISWQTGSMGGSNFAAPCRLRPEARLARWWGMQNHKEAESYEGYTTAEANRFNFSLLGLRHHPNDAPTSTTNGVVYMAYTDEELTAAKEFYHNFSCASLCRIPISQFEAVSWQSLPDVDFVYCVVIDESFFKLPSFTSPILQSYVDYLCEAFGAYGRDFREEFFKSTHGWSRCWLDDRQRLVDWSDSEVLERFVRDSMLKDILPQFFAGRKGSATYSSGSLESPEENTWERQTVFTGCIAQKDMKYFTFGMGSLINTPSRVGTAGAVAQSAIPVRISSEYEFCPCWNFQNYAGGSQLTAGGMIMRSDARVKDPKAETIGIIYPCPGDDAAMKAQDEREVGYTRYNIPLKYIHVLDHWQKVPEGVTVFQYVPNTELPDDHECRAKLDVDGDRSPKLIPRAPFPVREYPLSQTYVDTCILGCLEYSRDMAEKWIKGFVGWPEEGRAFWLNDRKMARRPWMETPKYDAVDAILMDVLPESFPCRKLSSEYGAHYCAWDSARGEPTSCQALDVRYSSYAQQSREVTTVQCEETSYFFFHAALMMSQGNYEVWAKFQYGSHGPFVGMPCRLTKQAGFRRSFCQHVNTNFQATVPALIDASEQDARDVLGVLQAVPKGWLQASGELPEYGSVEEGRMDKMIKIHIVPHRRVELSTEHLEVLRSYMCIPKGARVFTYIVSEPLLPCFDWPISQLYLDSVLSSCLKDFGEDFCKELVDSTDGWARPDGSCYWLNDRKLPRRPWVHQPNYKVFDRIVLESKSPLVPAGVLYKRRLPEEYSALNGSS